MMMLALIVMVQAVSILPPPPPAPTFSAPLQTARLNYRACVVGAALKMERSGADVSLIADTAIGTCHDYRDTMKAQASTWLEQNQPSLDTTINDDVAEGFAKKIDADYRADAVAAILEQRASKKP